MRLPTVFAQIQISPARAFAAMASQHQSHQNTLHEAAACTDNPETQGQYHMPTAEQAGMMTLGFRREQITPATVCCIQGHGGEQFVDRADRAYQWLGPITDNIVNNRACRHPCVLDIDSISECNLNPGPFKRLMCALLVEAWRVNHQFGQPMQASRFQDHLRCLVDRRGAVDSISNYPFFVTYAH